MDAETALSRREVTLRAGATTCLAGVALVQAVGLPPLLAQGWLVGLLSMAAMALCIGLGWALAAVPAARARRLWRMVAAAAGLVLLGWVVSHLFAIPGLAGRGDWTAMPGTACAILAAACLVAAAIAAPPRRGSVRGLLTTVAVLVAFAPGAGVVLVGLGPGTLGGETVLASGGHLHSHASPEAALEFQTIAGGQGGHYVFRTAASPRHTPVGVAVIVAAAFIFTAGALTHLRRRALPAEGVALSAGQVPA
jgi:hypothetical protein